MKKARLLVAVVASLVCAPGFKDIPGPSRTSVHTDQSSSVENKPQSPKDLAAAQLRQYLQGYRIKLWLSNKATIGENAWPSGPPAADCPTGLGMEYVPIPCVEHLYGAGPAIAGIVNGVPRVSSGYNPDDATSEFYGDPNGSDSFQVIGKGISDNDVYVSYTDTFRSPAVTRHVPMGIRITQESFAWAENDFGAILPLEYRFINVGNVPINDVYVGFIADPDVGPLNVGGYFSHNYSCYIPGLLTGYADNAADLGSTPVGITLLEAPKSLDSLKLVWQWFGFDLPGSIDSVLYAWMSGQAFPPDQHIGVCQSPSYPTDTRFLLSVGPVPVMMPGDTLRLAVALVGGASVASGEDNMKQNASNALLLHARGYTLPPTLPAPALHASLAAAGVMLHWGPDQGSDPMEVWDDSSQVAGSFPDTSWRRIDPPSGHTRGGRIFKGYRLYRSTDSVFTPAFTQMLGEFDLAGDSTQGGVSIDTTYVDSTRAPGTTYWYGVTALSIQNSTDLTIPVNGVPYAHYTLYGLETESTPLANSLRVLTGVDGDRPGIPKQFLLQQNYPDPFNPVTAIGFEVPVRSTISLKVYNILGELIDVIRRDEVCEPGRYSDRFAGSGLASGVYVYRLVAAPLDKAQPAVMRSRKMLLIR